MGSFISAHSMFTGKNESNERNEQNKDRICYSCSEKINVKTFIICVRCKIALHKDCEESYGHKYYTICPNPVCNKEHPCGTLGMMYVNA
jgi:hypothetical protein